MLEDETIYKLGVAPADDAKYLYRDYQVILKSFVDLRHVVQAYGYQPAGLAGLSKMHLGILLDKNWRIRCSNWEDDVLTENQIIYAAADAHVAILIFMKVLNNHKSSGIVSVLTGKQNGVVSKDFDKICEKFVNLNFNPANIVGNTKSEYKE